MQAQAWPRSDGIVTLRPPQAGDAQVLVAGRDEEWERWLAPGDDEPHPTACIVVSGEIVGWVDYAVDSRWLGDHEVEIGYNVFAAHRRKGYATRGVQLLLDFLREHAAFERAYVEIDAENEASLGVARSVGAVPCGETTDEAGRAKVRQVVDLSPPSNHP